MLNKYNIYKAREDKDLSQSKLAELIGIAPSTLSQMVNGRLKPSLETVLKIADVLGVTVDYVLGRTEKQG